MKFVEGEEVMARWPSTKLFFHAKVIFVREEDNQYDVVYEDDTVYTLKAKDVLKNIKPRNVTPSRRCIRGRKSPARQPAKLRSVKSTEAKRIKKETNPKDEVELTQVSVGSIKHDHKVDGSVIGEDSNKNARSTARTASNINISSCSFSRLGIFFCMIISPLITITLHTHYSKEKCGQEIPNFPKDLKAYWDIEAFAAMFGFALIVHLLSLLPLGNVVKARSGRAVHLNGFSTLLIFLAALPVAVFYKMDPGFIEDKYLNIIDSSFILAFIVSTSATFLAKFFGRQNRNTGNLIVNFFNGYELNPFFARLDLKLQTFRFSMIGLAVLNVLLIINSMAVNNGHINLGVALTAYLQVAYALDSMYYEECYFFSFDAMSSKFGFALVSYHHSFPFLATFVTRYLAFKNPTIEWYCLVAIGAMNLIGYAIFRKTETQLCDAAKDAKSGVIKLLHEARGLWSFVRHPNYLGQILIQLSWVLLAACTTDMTNLMMIYFPVFTILMILCRCSEQNKQNEKKYGTAWIKYCERVPSNLIPKVF